MITKRIIPCLDVKDGKVVKGVNFVGLKEVGDPVRLARTYYEQGADELVFLDITATHEHRDTMVHIVEQTAAQVFMPFTVGGGIRTTDDIRRILRAGADKVSLNSATVRNPDLLQEALIMKNVHKQANRIKCATIGWKAMKQMIEESEAAHE